MKRQRCIILPLFLALIMSACTTAPTLSEQQVIIEYDQLAALKNRLREARSEGLYDLAPSGFTALESKLKEAISLGRSKRDGRVSALVEEAEGILFKAEADVVTTKSLMREVLEARQMAIAAGADSMMPDRFKTLDNKLRKAAQSVEEGNLERAKKECPNDMDHHIV